MKFSILPKNKLSKWSFWLLASSVFLFIIVFLLFKISEPDISNDSIRNSSLAIPFLLGYLASILAFVSGVYSIIVYKARSITIFVTSIISLLIAIVLLPSLIGLVAALFKS